MSSISPISRVALILLAILSLYAIWQRLEMLAIAIMLAMIAIIYKAHTKRLVNSSLDLMSNTQQAKFGNLEVQVREVTSITAGMSPWVQLVTSQLSSRDIGLLLLIHSEGRLKNTDHINFDSVRENLRELRYRGLLHHNQQTLQDSSEVWLTKLGTRLAEELLKSDSVANVSIAESDTDEAVDSRILDTE